MPLTAHGKRMKARMHRQYGGKQGDRVFYASVNAGKPGFKGSEGKRRKARRKRHGRGGRR